MKTLYVFDAKSKEIICSHTLNGQIISIDSNFVAVRNTKHITFFDRQDDWSVEVKDRDFDTCIAAFLHPNKKEFICLNTTGSFSRWYIEYNSRLYSYEMVTKPLSMIPSPDFKFAAILSEGKIELLNLEESNATPFQIENRKLLDLLLTI